MMKISTSNFGQLEVLEENIIHFANGIPGFADNKQYIIINDEDEDSPFCWLQNLEDPDLAFTMVNPFLTYENYEPRFPESELEKLGQGSPEDYSVLSMVIIPEDIKDMRANLMAPVVINLKTKKAKQIITEGDQYPVKYYLFKEEKNQAN